MPETATGNCWVDNVDPEDFISMCEMSSSIEELLNIYGSTLTSHAQLEEVAEAIRWYRKQGVKVKFLYYNNLWDDKDTQKYWI